MDVAATTTGCRELWDGFRSDAMLRILAAAFVLLSVPAVALAADPITVSIDSTGRSVPLAEGANDWSGFYAGIFGTAQQSDANGTQAGLGLTAGVNAQIDFVLVGAEVNLQGLTGDTVDTTYGQVVGRGGVVLNDDVLLYAAAGYGWDLAGGDSDMLAGGGVEFAVTDELSLNAQYLRGFDQVGDNAKDQVMLGARFHF
jgi:outer membrane immunogenic protein